MDRYTLRFSGGMCCHRMQSKDVKSPMLPASVIPPVRAKTSVLNTSPKRSCSEQYGRLSTKLLSLQGWQRGYREDQSPSMPSCRLLPFLSATLQSKFENIGLIETQCEKYLFLDHHEHIMGTARVRRWDQFKLSWCKSATPALPHAAGQLELQTSCLTHVSDLGISLRLPMLCSFINQQPPFLDAFLIIFLSPFGYNPTWKARKSMFGHLNITLNSDISTPQLCNEFCLRNFVREPNE